MIARAPTWVAGEDWRDVARWPVAACVVLCVHAALIAVYLAWHEPVETIGDDMPAIAIDLIAPEIDQLEQPKVEQPIPPRQTSTDPVVPKDEKPPPPQEATTDAIVPKEKPPEKIEPSTPVQRTTVQSVASAPHIDPSWQSLLIKHIQHFKRYPQTARERNEQGVVVLAVSLDRDGHVLSHRIISGSGFGDLDAEVLALIERAQPMPAFPPSMREAQLDLTLPIRFSLR
jgi:periplasmic protein TonB